MHERSIKILGASKKKSRSFQKLDSSRRIENKFYKNLKNYQKIKKINKFIQKYIHNLKFKFWGVKMAVCNLLLSEMLVSLRVIGKIVNWNRQKNNSLLVV